MFKEIIGGNSIVEDRHSFLIHTNNYEIRHLSKRVPTSEVLPPRCRWQHNVLELPLRAEC